MTSATRILLSSTVVVTALLAAGCGKSGDQPPIIPEVRVVVTPDAGGTAAFELVELQGNGQRYTSLAGQTIAIRANFNIFLEGAVGPYSVTIRQKGDAPIRVRLFNVGASIPTLGEGVTSVPDVDFSVGTGSTSAVQARPEVRFDVCAPIADATTCSILGMTSEFGPPFTGSIGDPFSTRLIGPSGSTDEPDVATPAVYFFEKPRYSIDGIFRSVNHRLLQAELWVDRNFEDSDSGTDDVVVRADL